MVVKTITITEEAYNALKRLKKEHESFSQGIIRIAEGRKADLSKYFGILKDSKTLDNLRKNIKRDRKYADIDIQKRQEKLRR